MSVGQDRGAPIGTIMTPKGMEATPDSCYFWVPDGVRIEKTQWVTCVCAFPDGVSVTYYGQVDEVRRIGEAESPHEARYALDGDPTEEDLSDSYGTTIAKMVILTSQPELFTPPLEKARVFLSTPRDVSKALGYDKIKLGIPYGLLRNGASGHAGPLLVDLSYVNGDNGAHYSDTGTSGVSAKTSAALFFLKSWLLSVEKARAGARWAEEQMTVVPIAFNVKGFDLLWVDKPSKDFASDPRHAEMWREMGLEPGPFRNARFLVPGSAKDPLVPRRTVTREGLEAYSWGLADVVEQGLFPYLFTDDAFQSDNFRHLLGTWQSRLTGTRNGRRVLREPASWPHNPIQGKGLPQTFQELLEVFQATIQSLEGRDDSTSSVMDRSHVATIQKFYRLLSGLKQEASGVLAWDTKRGRPPQIKPASGDGHPELHVIDLNSIAHSPSTQRFVIAAVVKALKDERTSPNRPSRVYYPILLDEMNRWAPAGSSDPISKLFELIAGEFRSLGLELISCQQFASKVNSSIPENSAMRVIGRSGPKELSDSIWSFLSDWDKKLIQRFGPGEKLVTLPTLRAPAAVKLPFPAWATKEDDVDGAKESVREKVLETTPAGTTRVSFQDDDDLW